MIGLFRAAFPRLNEDRMLPYLLVCITALVVACLTLFSGFGLGTLLMPAFAVFFPLEVAVAATAVVHLANNLFKLALWGKHADRKVVLRFAIPAVLAAFAGAWLLGLLSTVDPIATYPIGSHRAEVTLVKLIIAVIIVGFAVIELQPRFDKLAFPPKYLPVGGVISGFFGGLSGHQGALRSGFLIRAGLSKEAFIGTSVVCSVLVDLARLVVYGLTFFGRDWALLRERGGVGLVVAASVAAFAGTLIGTRLVEKVTLRGLKITVGVMLLIMAAALATGLV